MEEVKEKNIECASNVRKLQMQQSRKKSVMIAITAVIEEDSDEDDRTPTGKTPKKDSGPIRPVKRQSSSLRSMFDWLASGGKKTNQ